MSKVPLIAVLVIFVGFFFFPYFYNVTVGKLGSGVPDLQPPKGEHCIEDEEWMSENHMVLLKEWRDAALRHGIREYVSETYGDKYYISTYTCFECHQSKAEFCDKCHEYVGVKPNCWDCHITPELLQEHNK
ncbi:putative sulfite reductase-associated electron transfer protein DsrJ [Archaeoglobus sulfaticallidus PM70-1]|uniref:Putative sulfite reductase-associated electron transfer protein DsrJ n=1 Tax=Archaeoglobus sulfaticallidus PM70-1 TaxID=387631 RepID=N0BF04_9EURY|nr:sulfate reduction electron transfer complex DsrMKJOP subunit DsrJ [Archaeoglobus sulfaticallidus]AGK62239.1 putative sulfite reductase-associated electron transfer protein DsrJ [Archaeoglobus sulfaticallidus PM70-1]